MKTKLKFEREVCNAFKWGEYNPLRCCREKGHIGEHCYVVVSAPAELIGKSHHAPKS